jgi:signal transduction histidine kinase
LNIILNTTTFDVSTLFRSDIFSDVTHFLENPEGQNNFQSRLNTNRHHFLIQVVIFADRCFEIIIRDTSLLEKDNFNRAEMANNITHELFTPVTSIRGYLETLIEHPNLPAEKQQKYLQRTYSQTIRLSEIIQDAMLLSRVHSVPHSFLLENVNLYEVLQHHIHEVDRELIAANKTVVQIYLNKNATVKGNRTLIDIIFFNLGRNALKYAGENCTLTINQYMEDDNFHYFSFADNGPGIEEKVLDRIFERFYRVSEGRSRDSGGSGLGLSLVKAAVSFHHGQICARNRAGGGLEFLFTLRKY